MCNVLVCSKELKNWILLAFCFTERNKTKRWLPQSGAYNLNEMLDLFQWFYLHKIEGRNPFWKLLELIAESNDYENVNNAQVDEVPDVEGAYITILALYVAIQTKSKQMIWLEV